MKVNLWNKECRLFAKVKKAGVLFLALLLLSFSGCSSSSQPKGSGEATVELKLAHFFPGTHPAETELIQPWAKAIEEATNGQVKITSYPNQTLLQADAIYDGVENGIADLGLSCFSYTRGRFPVLEVFELPGVTYKNSKVASKVAWEGIRQLKPKEVQDTKLMMVLTTGSGDLFTKVPVRSHSDLQGLGIRATGLSAQTLQVLGANPVAMPQSEAYEALSKGVVKGNLAPVEVLQGWKHAEVTEYLTLTPFLYNTLFFVTMNLDKWNALAPDVQSAIEKVNEEYFEIAFNMKQQLCRPNSILIVIGYSGCDNHINKLLQDCINSGLLIYWYLYDNTEKNKISLSDDNRQIKIRSQNSENKEDTTKLCFDDLEAAWAEKSEKL